MMKGDSNRGYFSLQVKQVYSRTRVKFIYIVFLFVSMLFNKGAHLTDMTY